VVVLVVVLLLLPFALFFRDACFSVFSFVFGRRGRA